MLGVGMKLFISALLGIGGILIGAIMPKYYPLIEPYAGYILGIGVLFVAIALFLAVGEFIKWCRNKKKDKEKNESSMLDIPIKQLQDSSLVTRLTGIDGLNRIALNSPKDYLYTVIDILTAFIKEKSPLPQSSKTQSDEDIALNDIKDLPLDIEKAVQVIGDFKKSRRKNKNHTIDLSGIDLRNISLINADLRWINFEWAILRGAKLNGAKLESANLDSVDIRWADLTDTDLHRANLWDTKYNENTIFPKGFNSKDYNMLFLSMDNDP